jgi:hypothetical protein
MLQENALTTASRAFAGRALSGVAFKAAPLGVAHLLENGA